jgi:large subunit ribosomal protein L22
MISKAQAKFIRISPRKVREVIDLIRGRRALDALNILENINKRARKPVIKVLKSAISNSRQFQANESNLYISKIVADEGPMLKRYRAAAFGRAVMVRHRLCHITVELDEHKKVIPPKEKKEKKEVRKKRKPNK